ncbi:unnamed protein product, partial [Coregonus sp. 'balchen']
PGLSRQGLVPGSPRSRRPIFTVRASSGSAEAWSRPGFRQGSPSQGPHRVGYYPLSPPKMRFTCDMFHPNIYPDGRVCISILHAPGDDPMGYESSAERWSPVQSVEKILLSVVSMLAEPNDESGANVDASKMWRTMTKYLHKVTEPSDMNK